MNTQKRVPLGEMGRLKPENAAAEISRLNQNLARRAQELAMLNKAGQMLTSSLDLNEVLATALDEVCRLLDVVGASVWLLEPAPGEGPPNATRWLVCRQASGAQQEVVRHWRLAPGQGIVGWVAQNGQPLIVPDAQADERHFQEVDQRTGLSLRSILSAPLQVKETVIGVLQVVDTQANRFTTDDLALVEPLAAFAAIAVENARLYAEAKRLRDFNEEIVQSMEEGVLLENATGYITFANTKMTELLGTPADALVGQHWTGIAAADSLLALHEWRGQSPENPATHYETELVAAEGRHIPALVSGRLLWTPAAEPGEARFAGMLAVFTDITERKEGEAALRRRNKDLATLNAIAAAAGQPVGLDQTFRVILDKALEVTGMPAGAIHLLDITKGVLTLAAQHGLPTPLRTEVKTVPLGQGPIGQAAKWSKSVVQERAPAQEGDKLRGYAGLPITSHNRVLGVFSVYSHSLDHLNVHEVQLLTAIANQIGVVVENTRRAEDVAQMEILRELNRLRSELIANASHELRTPLGLIKVFCTSLLAEDVKFDAATRQQFLRGIDEETDKLKLIVDNLLGLSTLESGRLRLDRQPTDLKALAQQVTEAMQLEMEKSGEAATQPQRHHFVLDFPPAPMIVPIDAKRIEQVLRNLLNNAIKYSPDGGAVTIQGRGDKWQALLRVSDEGIGMQPEDLERIFDRFYRVEDEATRSIGGVGLGLAVCKGLVEAHGGRIWAESTPGVGSQFYFTLPMGEQDEL